MIFFDLDDTLLDGRRAQRLAVQAFPGRTGLLPELSDEEVFRRWKALIGRYLPRYFDGSMSFQQQRRLRLRGLLGEEIGDEEADRLFAIYLQAYEEHWALFDDVLPALGRLSGQRLGLITNGDPEQQRRKLARLGLQERFETVVVSGELGVAKPDAAIFHHACRCAGVGKGECLYVGDRHDIDVLGAEGAGWRGVLIQRDESASVPPGVRRIASLLELEALVSPRRRPP